MRWFSNSARLSKKRTKHPKVHIYLYHWAVQAEGTGPGTSRILNQHQPKQRMENQQKKTGFEKDFDAQNSLEL